MKRSLLAIPLSLFVLLSSVAFAAEGERPIPELPPQISVSGGQYHISGGLPFENAPEEARNHFDTLQDGPFLVAVGVDQPFLSSGSITKKSVIYFIKPSSIVSQQTDFGFFNYTDPLKIDQMQRGLNPVKLAGGSGFDVMCFAYNESTGKHHFQYFQKNMGYLSFAFVIGSSPLSNSAPFYPGYRTLRGNYNFTTGPDNPKDPDRHYNWWLSVEGGDLPIIPPDINIDTDGDGKPDINIDTDGDGKPDINIDKDGDRKPDINIDTDGDGKPDINIDKDGDGKPDINIDKDGDGKPDINIDNSGNGNPDTNIDNNGDGKPDTNIDSNGDGKPDINVDKDGDGKPDINIDKDGDLKPDINVDTDGDGKPNINIDKDGDGKPDINIDTDGDKKPNINIDKDGDGKPDINIDTDGDGKPDQNIDSDGDGKPDTDDPGSGGGGGTPGGGTGSGDIGGGWYPPDYGQDLPFNGFPIFDPFDYDNYTPPSYNNPYTDYDPLEGYDTTPTMPEFEKPDYPPYEGYDPFKNPWK